MPFRRAVTDALSPAVWLQIMQARQVLASVSGRPWRDAWSLNKRLALEQSRLSILPPWFRKSPSFVIDVGANQGQWIGALLEILPVEETWIFEPNPEAMKICRRRVGDRNGARYFDMALGDKTGQITLHVTAASDFASVLQPRDEFLKTHYGKTATEVVIDRQVEVRTLDSLVPESKPVDLLKIDVQGFERAVLSGAGRVLANTRAVLIEANLESHYVNDDNFPAIWMLLAERGFSFWNLSTPFRGQGGKALWADAVFVR